MKVGAAVGVVVGLGLMAAPAVLGYVDDPAADVHRIVGPLVASLALIAAWEATAGVRWANLLLAAVAVAAPVVVHHGPGAAVVGILGGVALAAATPFGGRRTHRFAGGWRALADGAATD